MSRFCFCQDLKKPGSTRIGVPFGAMFLKSVQVLFFIEFKIYFTVPREIFISFDGKRKTLLRLFTGVVFRVVAVVLDFTGVDVAVGGKFSDSESDSSGAVKVVCFLATGANNLGISFWFSAKLFCKVRLNPFSKSRFFFH